MTKRAKPTSNKKKINLALQGGGAHGAFTWGALDHLLSDERVDIEGISGTSAGAINAVMLADGLARGGPEEARKRLAEFWRAASRDGNLTDLQRVVMDRLLSFVPYEGSAVQAWFDAVSRYMSPYDLNPLNTLLARQNRLRLEAEIVRDAHLTAAGLLTSKIGGPSVRPALPARIGSCSPAA